VKPRITMCLNAEGQFELFLNAAGRDALVRELLALSEKREHFHLMPDEWGGVETCLSLKAYHATDKIIESGKVLFRTDKDDRTHYPHVLNDGE
jgi:hypothetical protein